MGTSDGRVKLVGRTGVEVTLQSATRSPTKWIHILENKGALLRLDEVRSLYKLYYNLCP